MTQPRIVLTFYHSETGNEPVREWLKDLPEDDRRCIGQDLMRLQFRWPVGMPLCRPLGSGLWEVRTDLPSSRIARIILCFNESELIALHGFIKKTQKTPKPDLALALSGKKSL